MISFRKLLYSFWVGVEGNEIWHSKGLKLFYCWSFWHFSTLDFIYISKTAQHLYYLFWCPLSFITSRFFIISSVYFRNCLMTPAFNEVKSLLISLLQKISQKVLHIEFIWKCESELGKHSVFVFLINELWKIYLFGKRRDYLWKTDALKWGFGFFYEFSYRWFNFMHKVWPFFFKNLSVTLSHTFSNALKAIETKLNFFICFVPSNLIINSCVSHARSSLFIKFIPSSKSHYKTSKYLFLYNVTNFTDHPSQKNVIHKNFADKERPRENKILLDDGEGGVAAVY